MRRVYIAAIHKDEDSDFTAIFPGVPGCITAGSTMEELEAMTREALQGHLEVLRDSGQPVPEALDIAAAKAHEDGIGASFFLAVPVYMETGKIVRLNITMPSSLVDQVDRYAKANRLSRSAFLAQAARRAMPL